MLARVASTAKGQEVPVNVNLATFGRQMGHRVEWDDRIDWGTGSFRPPPLIRSKNVPPKFGCSTKVAFDRQRPIKHPQMEKQCKYKIVLVKNIKV